MSLQTWRERCQSWKYFDSAACHATESTQVLQPRDLWSSPVIAPTSLSFVFTFEWIPLVLYRSSGWVPVLGSLFCGGFGL